MIKVLVGLFLLNLVTFVYADVESTVTNNYIKSPDIMFDFILDEKINKDDPRIKSIVYIVKQNSKNFVEIKYFNSNAQTLSNWLCTMLINLGIKVVNNGQLISSNLSDTQSKNVYLTIDYYNLKIESKGN